MILTYVTCALSDTKAGDGERAGDAVRAGIRGGAAGHAGDLHAEVVDRTSRHGGDSERLLRVRASDPAAGGSDAGDLGGGGEVLGVDGAGGVRLRAQLPHRQVPAGAEQGDGHGRDRRRGAGAARAPQLAADDAPRVGPRRGRRGAERVVVVHSGGSACVHLQWDLWEGLVWVFMDGLSQSLGFP